MGHAEHLPQLSHFPEFHADLLRRLAADAGVDLVEDQRGDAVPVGNNAFQRQHDTGQFTAGCDACQRSRFFAPVRRNEKFQAVHAVNGQFSRGMLCRQHHVRHIQKFQLFGHFCRKALQCL